MKKDKTYCHVIRHKADNTYLSKSMRGDRWIAVADIAYAEHWRTYDGALTYKEDHGNNSAWIIERVLLVGGGPQKIEEEPISENTTRLVAQERRKDTQLRLRRFFERVREVADKALADLDADGEPSSLGPWRNLPVLVGDIFIEAGRLQEMAKD